MKTKPGLVLAALAPFALCPGARAASNDWLVVDLRTGAVSCHDYDLATATNTFNTATTTLIGRLAIRRRFGRPCLGTACEFDSQP